MLETHFAWYETHQSYGACSLLQGSHCFCMCQLLNSESLITMPACRTLARTNHSCCNNASYHFKADGTVIMRAVAPITEGSEITISYVDLLESLGPRQGTLWERYAIQCTCARYAKAGEALLLLLCSRMVHSDCLGCMPGALSPNIPGRVNVLCGRRVVCGVWASGSV